MTSLVQSLLAAMAEITGSYGWSILLLTLAIRLLLVPLYLWQQRAGTNLLAGCLPALAQWPVFMAMYGALSGFPVAVNAGFFWLRNLGAPDPYLILPLLVVATSAWQTWATVPREQRATMMVMPLLMGLFVVKASAAVSLYWVASNIFGLVQHYLLARRPAMA